MSAVKLMNSVACVSALLLAGLATDANAAPVAYSICLFASSNDYTQPDSTGLATASYSNGGCSDPYGVGLTYSPSASSTLTTNPSEMILGLTTAGFDLASFQENGSAFASLETGSMRVLASAGGLSDITANNAVFADRLQFTITDGAPSALITVYVHLAGGQSGGDPVYSNWAQFGLGGAGFTYYTQYSPPAFGYSGPPHDFASFSGSLTDSGFDIVGTVSVTDGERTSVEMILAEDCRTGTTCDYTATFNWDLPSNVTVTTGSGVLLSQ